ncbi:high affinity copper uptake protein 1-like isoform X2 [Patiria miniata]|uniref:Copper transport protein n=1 Tax=Patiria miniata TaxID=46514 RepID=A0A914AJE6_PATMI|nr:high affinity copper uptake protein 1-like isoform X2 [Patiria miniata]
MMNKTFHFSDMIMDFLFQGCNIDSWPDMIAAVGAVFLVAVFLELMKLLNSKLKQKRCKSPLEGMQEPVTKRQSSINGQSGTQQSPLLASLRIPSSVSKIRQRRLKFHMVESILHIFQVSIGYILMLVVMTYNAYLLITVVLALTAGYFFLAPLRRMREPRRVPVRHESLTDSEQRAFSGSTSSTAIIESAENVQNPHYGSLYE